ncbi:MAG: tetratricopeptide repeat protein [Candidatus Brocadiaceae bacterium]|jgi:non-specific serine/threonine protein kinase
MDLHEAETHWVLIPSKVLSGRYQVVEEVGRGGMGIVYHAYDTLLQEDIAVKVLTPVLDLDARGVERLKDEARVAHRLSHPNIVQLRSFEEDGSIRFLIMELVRGPSLGRLVRERGPLPFPEVRRLAEGICAGLEYAHSRKVVHCDIKPGNFLLAEDNVIKITDFGVARVAHDIMDRVTQQGVVGTPAYMSPEQLAGERIDARTDIYSLAATLWHLLSGAPPFEGHDARNRPSSESLRPIAGAPPYVTHVLQRALREKAEKRWPGVAEFHLALTSPSTLSLKRRIPSSLTAFFGREGEMSRLEALLTQEHRRLVTLTGPGGSGKTRLAREACARMSEAFDGAVWFVPLQDVSDPDLIGDAILEALQLSRLPHLEPLEQAVAALSQRASLVVLDNYEQLVEGGTAVVAELLERCPALQCLVTSRERLNLTGERELSVLPLPVPEEEQHVEELKGLASVRLFVDRAQAAHGEFALARHNAEAVAELCRRLEGIPLALELAASRAAVLTPSQMLEGMEDRFAFLVSRKRDVPERHRTLAAAMDWSYALLQPELQRFFARLAVFRGGWTAEAAEKVSGEADALDRLLQLRECSLVLAEPTTEAAEGMRFRMLETIREYAQQQLSTDELSGLRRRHADYYLALAEEAGPKVHGDQHVASRRRLTLELDNLRAAIEYYGPPGGDPDAALRLAAALGRFWQAASYWSEGRAHLREVLASSPPDANRALRARVLSDAGGLASSQGDYRRAEELFGQALETFRQLGDSEGIAGAVGNLANVAWRQGKRTRARELFEESVQMYRELGDEHATADLLGKLGGVEREEGNLERARSLLDESLAICRAAGKKEDLIMPLNRLGLLAHEEGDDERAHALLMESLAIARAVRKKDCIAIAINNLGLLYNLQGKPDSARPMLEESLKLSRQLGHKTVFSESVEGLAEVWAAEGDPERAARLFAAAEGLRDSIGYPLAPPEQETHDRIVQELHSTLGDAAFNAVWSVGSGFTLQEMAACALGQDEE